MFGHFFFQLGSFLSHIMEQGGYWVVFLISTFESLPMIGALIPGQTLVIASGFFVRLGFLNFWIVFLLASAGAILGDLIGYYAGRKYGYNLILKYAKYFLLKKEHIEKARQLTDKHTGKAILAGRFSPVTRFLMPFFIGASHVHIKKFWLWNVVSGITWALVSISIGYIFGYGYHAASKYLGKYLFIAFVLGVLIIWGFSFVNKRRHIFRKYDIHILTLNLVSLYLFFKTMQDALMKKSFLLELDVWISITISKFNNEFMDLAKVISNIFSPTVLSIVASIYTIYALFKKRWDKAFLVFSSFAGGLIINGILKAMIGRERPIDALIHYSDMSFPSGHALASTIFFSLLVFLFTKKITNNYLREIFVVASVLLVISVCISRIYLNVHWFSDVLSGIALGLFWSTLMMLLARFFKEDLK